MHESDPNCLPACLPACSQDYMMAYCQWSCGVCDQVVVVDDSGCYDTEKDCGFWAQEGYCDDPD